MPYGNLVLSLVSLLLGAFSIRDVQAKIEAHIWCGACIALMEDMKIQISSVEKGKKLQVGSSRIELDGSRKVKEVPYSTSDLFLIDELERICNAMHYYGETTNSKGDKIIIRTSSYDGTSISMKNVRKDHKLTSILQYACDTIIEEHEDAILRILKTFHNEKSEVEKEICVTETAICSEDELKSRMWTMAQAVMAGIQEKADERLNESKLSENEENAEEEEEAADVDNTVKLGKESSDTRTEKKEL